MQNRTTFRVVDWVAGKHSVVTVFDSRCLGDISEQSHGCVVHKTFRPIEEQIVELGRIAGESLRILFEGGAYWGAPFLKCDLRAFTERFLLA